MMKRNVPANTSPRRRANEAALSGIAADKAARTKLWSMTNKVVNIIRAIKYQAPRYYFVDLHSRY
jgi:hypothetical protein